MVDNTHGNLLTASIFPHCCRAHKNTMELLKYPRILSTKTLNKVYNYVRHQVIIIFLSVSDPSDPDAVLIKRVIGVAGDHVK